MNRKTIRKRHGAEFKARVALEALREQKTAAQIAGLYGVHPTQVGLWKKQAKQGLAEVFASGRAPSEQERQALVDELYKQIGQLTMELDWLKKKCE